MKKKPGFQGEIVGVMATCPGERTNGRVWASCNEQMYALHVFDHPRYCDHINPKQAWDERIELQG